MDHSGDKPSIAHLGKMRKLVKRLKSELYEAAPDVMLDPEFIKLRRRLISKAESAMSDPSNRQTVFRLLWTNAFHGVAYVYRGAWRINGALTAEEKQTFTDFLSQAKADLTRIGANYVDLAFATHLATGDLQRYAAQILFSKEHEAKAIAAYSRAVAADPSQGHAFNQLGLAVKESRPRKALVHFLRALIADKPYPHAEEALAKLVKDGMGKNDVFKVGAELGLVVVKERFDRLIFDGPKSAWVETFKAAVEDDEVDYGDIIEALGVVVMACIVAIQPDHSVASDEKLRFLVQVVSEDFKVLLKELTDHVNSSSCEDRCRKRFLERRTNAHSSQSLSDDDYRLFSDDEDTTESEQSSPLKNASLTSATRLAYTHHVLAVLGLLIDWIERVDAVLGQGKPTVAMRMILQTLTQLVVDTVNRYNEHVLPTAVGRFAAADPRSQIAIWLLRFPGRNLPTDYLAELVSWLLERAQRWQLFPIVFEGYYKLRGKQQADLQRMQKMAELQSLHAVPKTDFPPFERPSFVLPDAEVFRNRLYVIRGLVAAHLPVLVTTNVMQRFDSIKTRDTEVRSAVRYIESKATSGDVILLPHDSAELVDVAKDFADSREGEISGDIIVLLPSREPLRSTKHSKIFSEGVDRFFDRFMQSKKAIGKG